MLLRTLHLIMGSWCFLFISLIDCKPLPLDKGVFHGFGNYFLHLILFHCFYWKIVRHYQISSFVTWRYNNLSIIWDFSTISRQNKDIGIEPRDNIICLCSISVSLIKFILMCFNIHIVDLLSVKKNIVRLLVSCHSSVLVSSNKFVVSLSYIVWTISSITVPSLMLYVFHDVLCVKLVWLWITWEISYPDQVLHWKVTQVFSS